MDCTFLQHVGIYIRTSTTHYYTLSCDHHDWFVILSAVEEQHTALDTATGLFYDILHYVTMDTQKYPPTCQFFSSALTILGQQFLSKMPDQSLQVLQVLIDRPQLASLLIPIFDPNSAPSHFLSQYQQVVDIGFLQHNLPVVFALISKVRSGN